MSARRAITALLLLCGAALIWWAWNAQPNQNFAGTRSEPTRAPARSEAQLAPATAEPSANADMPTHAIDSSDATPSSSTIPDHPIGRAGEALLSFRNDQAYRRFLAQLAASGLTVLARNDRLQTVRVRSGDLSDLERAADGISPEDIEVSLNTLLRQPTPPPPEARATRAEVPIGNDLLAALGVTSDNTTWGQGVTIAILDSGVAADTTFGRARIRSLHPDGTPATSAPENAHGTAVAALAGGASPDARGVAPGAQILSIHVTDKNGVSDAYTISEAILTAVDAGARVLNVSLGGYAPSPVLTRAIDYASARGAVIVASAGNDQAAQLTWPAADPRVISVGAVDALEQQVRFSNSGPQLQIAAPGYGVRTAGLAGERFFFSGTSASAPIVSGAIAAVMSTSPGLPPAQAWEVLQRHSNDAGAPGADPRYGRGVLNLGWAMARNQPDRIDSAISSHHYNEARQQIEVIVQNRGSRPLSELNLRIAVNGNVSQQPVSWLDARATQVIAIPLASTPAGTPVRIETVLHNPASTSDAFPRNNQRASLFSNGARGTE